VLDNALFLRGVGELTAGDPDLAADYLNTLAQEFIQQNQESRLGAILHTGDWLSHELGDTRDKLRKSEDALQEYARNSGIILTNETNMGLPVAIGVWLLDLSLGNPERDYVAGKLKEWGLEVTTGIGKTGVVGTIRVGNNPRAIGLRADMDALPMDEHNTFDHRSQHKGRMHACGHDGHTTMLLGAAKYLSATRNFDGTVHLIFQPAEEGRGGALAMVEDGLFEKFPCEQIFGMHNRPKLEVGKFAIRSGPQMAGGGLFDIKITGKGAHGARPETGIDPVIIATQIISALQSVVSRNVAPLDSAVISVTQMHAGDAYNVIPQEAVLRGTIRAFRKETMALVKERIETISKGIAQTLGGKAEADVRIAFPPLVNDKDAVKFIADVAAEIVGEANMNREGPYVMASEDFSYMLEKVPGAFINIGNGGGEGGCEVHNPSYDFNDDIITLGATLWSRVVETKLRKDAR